MAWHKDSAQRTPCSVSTSTKQQKRRRAGAEAGAGADKVTRCTTVDAGRPRAGSGTQTGRWEHRRP